MSESVLSRSSYGKSGIRLTKVVRRPDGLHELFEIEAAITLEGDFSAAYTAGDNRQVIATDTIKNTVYVLAKEQAFASIEAFAALLAQHFVATYPQVAAVHVELSQTLWQRIATNAGPHPHAFTDGGTQRRLSEARLDRSTRTLALHGGVRGLRLLKTTASEWRDFHRDRYRTLPDTTDRILASQVDALWRFAEPPGANPDDVFAGITASLLGAFASTHSLGVQQTIMEMGKSALETCEAIDEIDFALPNLHRIPFNLAPFGLAFENDIYVATDEPYGLIRGTIKREART